jgi:hypothetical protein
MIIATLLFTMMLALMGAFHSMPPIYYFFLAMLEICAILGGDWE